MDRERQVRPPAKRRQVSPNQRNERTSPARLIVPASMAICLLLVLVTFATAGKPSSEDQVSSTPAAQKDESNASSKNAESDAKSSDDEKVAKGGDDPTGKTGAAIYKVKPGDSFGAIAEKTGIEVSELADLNPDVDPRALQPGQQLKLR